MSPSAPPPSPTPDHRAFLRSLSLEERLRLNARSNWVGLFHLAIHAASLAVTGTLIAVGVVGWPILMLVHGIFLVFLFTLQHETCHQTPFASRRLNQVVGLICGIILFLPPKWFRYFHFAHHRFTQDPERDPELAEPKPDNWRAYIIHVSGFPVHFSQLKTLLRNARGRGHEDFIPETRRDAVTGEARAMLALYTALGCGSWLLGSTLLLYVWILPLMLGQPFLRLYLLAEHGRCPMVANMFENTRTTFTSWGVRRLAWNMPYHAEHHAYPTVPFFRLPELHERVRPFLGSTSQGYRAFHNEYRAGFQEDPDTGR